MEYLYIITCNCIQVSFYICLIYNNIQVFVLWAFINNFEYLFVKQNFSKLNVIIMKPNDRPEA